jgi:ABC-type phosphate/phosphonate transport system permease subunit
VSASLENRRRRSVATREVSAAEAGALAERLACALESIATELERIRSALEQRNPSQHEAAHAAGGPWLREHPPRGVQ